MQGRWVRTVLAVSPGTRFRPATVAGIDATVLRTPERPDFRDGHAVLLSRAPQPHELAALVREAAATHDDVVPVTWEADTSEPLSEAVLDAAHEAQAMVQRWDLMTLIELERPASAPPIDPTLATRDVDWAGFEVLQRWADDDAGHDGLAERGADRSFLTWWAAQVRARVEDGWGLAWLAHRMGIPASAVAVVRDGTGLAIVDGVVTHPAHRGHGLASALIHHAVDVHRRRHPEEQVVLVVDGDDGPAALYERLGFVRSGTTWQVRPA